MAYRLSEIWRFPVKSLRGQRFSELAVDPRGIAQDRHWMIVDHCGRFLTQRQHPKMAKIDAEVTDGRLHLRCLGMPPLEVRHIDQPMPISVQVWEDSCRAHAIDPNADRWLASVLGRPCRLVEITGDTVRTVDPSYGRQDDQVGFADGFPFLLISQASLDDLNNRLSEPVPMIRFRPNLVVTGTPPYAEDRWRRIRIGDVAFRVVKPCSRCIIPTIDLQTGERSREPLQTLAMYRRRANKIFFGQNLIHDGLGMLREGMSVKVLEWRND